MLKDFDIKQIKARLAKLLYVELAAKAEASHTHDDRYHTESEITTLLSGKAAASHTHAQSDITNLSSDLAGKQATLVSGMNIKTVNGSSVLGSGDLVVAAGYHHVSKTTSPATTGANTTPVDVPGAVFSYDANSTYFIRVMGRLNSAAATTGAGIHFNLSSAVTEINAQMIHPLAGSTLTGSFQITNDTSTGQSSGVPSGPIDVPVNFFALLVTGANSGTAQLRIRAGVSAVTELMTGAVMIVEKVL